MNDVLKQERHKLHMAADNINQMLEILQNRDDDRFDWAWQQLEANIKAAKGCFVGVSKIHCKKIDELFEDHKDLLAKFKQKSGPQKLNDEELKELTEGFKAFVEDMSERFNLEEFGAQ